MSDSPLPWLAVSAEYFTGDNLEPIDLRPSGVATLTSLSAPEDVRFAEVMGGAAVNVGVFEWTGGSTRSLGFPSDELVLVVAGDTTLTREGSGRTDKFERGEWFLVPRGWKGEWAGTGSLYREFAVVPVARWDGMFTESNDSPPSAGDESLEVVRVVSRREDPAAGLVHDGELRIILAGEDQQATELVVPLVESLVCVLSGSAALAQGTRALELTPGRAALTMQPDAQLRVPSGARVLIASPHG
jgi:uncharacterized cupin superfamily protein